MSSSDHIGSMLLSGVEARCGRRARCRLRVRSAPAASPANLPNPWLSSTTRMRCVEVLVRVLARRRLWRRPATPCSAGRRHHEDTPVPFTCALAPRRTRRASPPAASPTSSRCRDPPCDCSSERSTCVNMSKIVSSLSAGMPIPVSVTVTTASLVARDGHTNRSARRRVLAAVVEEIAEHLRQTDRIGVQVHRLGRHADIHRVAGGLRERLRRQHGLANHRRELHVTLAQLDAVVRDAAQIEEIVHQPHQLLELPFHGVEAATDGRVLDGAPLEDLQRIAQGASGLRSSCASVARNSSLRRSASARSAASARRLSSSPSPLRHVLADRRNCHGSAARVVQSQDLVGHPRACPS